VKDLGENFDWHIFKRVIVKVICCAELIDKIKTCVCATPLQFLCGVRRLVEPSVSRRSTEGGSIKGKGEIYGRLFFEDTYNSFVLNMLQGNFTPDDFL
jgi:hypothetical protein